MVDIDGRELVEGAFYKVLEWQDRVRDCGTPGERTVARYVGRRAKPWSVMGSDTDFGAGDFAEIGSRIPMPGEEGEIGEPAVFRSSGVTFGPAPDWKAAHIVLYSDTGEEHEPDEDEDEPDGENEAEPLPDGVYVDDMEDGVVTLWHHAGELGCTELTPAQARTLAAELVRVAAEVAAAERDADIYAADPTPRPSWDPPCPSLVMRVAPRSVDEAMVWTYPPCVDFHGVGMETTVDGVAYRATIPTCRSGNGYIHCGPDGKPVEFRLIDGQAFPFVAVTGPRDAEPEAEWARIARDRAKSGPGADHVLLDVEFPHGVGSFDPPDAVPKPGAPVMWPGPDGTVTVAEARAEAPEPDQPACLDDHPLYGRGR